MRKFLLLPGDCSVLSPLEQQTTVRVFSEDTLRQFCRDAFDIPIWEQPIGSLVPTINLAGFHLFEMVPEEDDPMSKCDKCDGKFQDPDEGLHILDVGEEISGFYCKHCRMELAGF